MIAWQKIIMPKTFELTLALLKPSTVARPHVTQAIVQSIIKSKLYILHQKCVQLNRPKVELFYREHQGKFFYNRLVTYMSSGPIVPMILCGHDAITNWRIISGNTKVYRTQQEAPLTIRGAFGISDTRNATHGSDSKETALREIEFFFPEFDFEKWHKEIEPCFRTNCAAIYFNKTEGIHQCCAAEGITEALPQD